MSRLRILAVAVVAALSFAAGLGLAVAGLGASPARGDTCTLPTCQTSTASSSPVTSQPVTSTPQSPPPKHQRKANPPPPRVYDLKWDNAFATGVLLTWKLSPAKDLAHVVVRRGPASVCPTDPSQGQVIGGGAIRSRQVDRTAVVGTHYCYAVFEVDRAHNVSDSNSTGPVARPDKTPPAPVTNATATLTGGHVVVSWPAVSGADHYLVMRGTGGGCPVAVSSASALKAQGTTLTDATAKPGAAYCYSVYAADAFGNVQKRGATSNTVTIAGDPTSTGSTPVASTGPATTAAKGSNEAFGSQLSRMIAAVGAATFVFGLIMLIGIRLQGSSGRRRVESFYYPRHRGGLARVALDQYDARALVIPAVLFVGLVVLAAAAALAL